MRKVLHLQHRRKRLRSFPFRIVENQNPFEEATMTPDSIVPE
jgi:hypothetical protein